MEGERTPPERNNAHGPAPGAEQHPRGNGEVDSDVVEHVDWNEPVKLDLIEKRFREANTPRLKEHTQDEYIRRFRVFAASAGIGRLSKRQLCSQGKDLVKKHLRTNVKRPSWRYDLAMLKRVWVDGLRCPWPVDAKRDIGRLPRTRPRETPPDEAIQKWAEAIELESDAYLKFAVLCVAQPGWRPSHVIALDPQDVRRVGDLMGIVRYPTEREFKTESPIGFRLPPMMEGALNTLLQERPAGAKGLLPWRSSRDLRVDPNKRLNLTAFGRLWDAFERKWNLPHVTPDQFRHWVASACRRAGLSKVASAWMLGHDATEGGAMRDWYDNPPIDDIFAEQADRLPNGPLGLLGVAVVRKDVELGDYAKVVKDYDAGNLGTMEMAQQMEAIRLRRMRSKPVVQP